jgi:hypothetical protein
MKSPIYLMETLVQTHSKVDLDLCRNTMKYINTHKHRDAVEIRLHFINNK